MSGIRKIGLIYKPGIKIKKKFFYHFTFESEEHGKTKKPFYYALNFTV